MRSASRTRMAGFWASWADCSPMIEARHPEVATQVIAQLEGHPLGHSLRAAANAAHSLEGVRGFEVPSWRALAAGLRPPRDPEEFQTGWQHEASSRIEQEHRETLFRVMAEPERHCSGLKVVLELEQRCRLVRPVLSLASTPLCSVFCCCDVCVSLCRCPRASAGVAVHSIPVVTTEQLAQGQGSWEDEGSRWKAQQQGFVAKEGHESHQRDGP